MKLDEARRDLYRRLAKEQGFRSRAAFKLIQANRKYDFLRRGGRVVDFGAAPGGWLQVCSQLVGPTGLVVGVDTAQIGVRGQNIKFLRTDVHRAEVSASLLELMGRPADVVLSDLAPSVSGVWELDHTRQVDLTLRVLDLCGTVLKKGGVGFFKLFEGERSREARDEFRTHFARVSPVKPAASRSSASELYYYCDGFRGTPSPTSDRTA